MAEKYGAKWLMAACLGAVALLNLLLPLACTAAEPDAFPWLVVALRALMGLCEVNVNVQIIGAQYYNFKFDIIGKNSHFCVFGIL